ncbi:MAG: HD domain-containing protein [Nitrospirae bacterium]|nr:MAG: HD domain-containing protein [Nitrospirota bacterium]
MRTLLLKNWLHAGPEQVPELYLVGGTVRDLVMGRVPKDMDLVCRGAERFAAGLAAGKKAALVVLEKKPHQPCYRVIDRDDGTYLDITEMRGSSIHDDLMQRDFTINAIAMGVDQDGGIGEAIDPARGAADIKDRVVRMVAEEAFAADPLRILRAVRFAALYGYEIEPGTLTEMKLRAPMLGDVSAERIMGELLQILATPESSRFVLQMDDLGILEIIFPEIVPMKTCRQNGYHHLDVWRHSLLVLQQAENIIKDLPDYFGDRTGDVSENLASADRLPLLKLAALLHDLGKPATRNTDSANGRISFYGHDEKGAVMLEAVARKMKMSLRDTGLLRLLVAEHLYILTLASGRAKPLTQMKWFRRVKDDAIPAIILGMADVMSIRGPDSTEEYRLNHIDWSKRSVRRYFEEIRAGLEKAPLVTGSDLIGMGMSAGPDIGRVLDQLMDAQDDGEVTTRQEALELAKRLSVRIS